MKRKKWLAVLLAGAVCIGMMAGCDNKPLNAQEDTVAKSETAYQGELSLVISHKDEYLGTLDQAVKASAEARGCTVNSVDCADDMDKQIENVQAAMENGARAILVVLVDDTRADEVVKAAGDAKVVFVNRIPQDTSILDQDHIYVGSDEEISGIYQGEMLADSFKKKGKDSVSYLMLEGTEGLVHTEKRSEGVLKALDNAGIKATAAAEPVHCGYDRAKAMEQMTLMLANGVDMSKVDCIIANNDAMALGVIESLRQNSIDMSHIAVVGIDGTNAGLQAVSDGSMLATVYQNAVGQASASVQAAINLASGKYAAENIDFEVDADNEHIIWVPFEKITADTVGEYY